MSFYVDIFNDEIFIVPDKLAKKGGEVGDDTNQYDKEDIFEVHNSRVRERQQVGKGVYSCLRVTTLKIVTSGFWYVFSNISGYSDLVFVARTSSGP